MDKNLVHNLRPFGRCRLTRWSDWACNCTRWRSFGRSQAKQGGSGGKAAPLSKKTGGKGSSGSKGGKAPNKLDSSKHKLTK